VSPHRLEVADVFRQQEEEFLERWRSTLSYRQLQTLRDIGACRTAALGAHLYQCDGCQRETLVYNSCLSRHCPKCGSTARDQWLAKHAEELLPVSYSHVIFTLPHELIPIVLQNPTVVYGIFFRAVSQALLSIAADPRHLGARLGFLAVLHTWNQKLLPHPHIHCLVPAGGISLNEKHWISCRNPRYFLPVQALAAKCQGKFLALLRRAFRKGKLRLAGTLEPLQHRKAFHRFTFLLKNKKWVAYVKKPFAGPQHVIQYLAHYTHRVAISNGRLLSFENGQVTFRWRDSAHGNQQKTMTLAAVEFMRRFLLHVLPRGFVKIRRFGYLANRERKSALQLCSALISSALANTPRVRTEVPPKPPTTRPCPYCEKGLLVPAGRLSPIELRVRNTAAITDTS
jgi:hypothetical protein